MCGYCIRNFFYINGAWAIFACRLLETRKTPLPEGLCPLLEAASGGDHLALDDTLAIDRLKPRVAPGAAILLDVAHILGDVHLREGEQRGEDVRLFFPFFILLSLRTYIIFHHVTHDIILYSTSREINGNSRYRSVDIYYI